MAAGSRGRARARPARRPATEVQGRLLLASVLMLVAMIAVVVAVARLPTVYVALEGSRVADAVSPRSWVAPLLVAAVCALAGLGCLVTAFRAARGRRTGSVGGPS